MAVYELRAKRVVFVLVGVPGTLTVVSLGLLTVAPGPHRFFFMFATLGFLAVALAYASSLKNHVVAGGSGQLRLFEGHLEVPPPWSGSLMHLPYESLAVRLRRVEGRIYGQKVSQVEVLILQSEGTTRELSSRMFESPERLQEAMEDILALKNGKRPPNRKSRGPMTGPKDEWDERLDAELDALD